MTILATAAGWLILAAQDADAYSLIRARDKQKGRR